MNSRVIIIGEDHINALGVIRVFGENNIKPYLYLISNKMNHSIIKSKYIGKYWICQNEELAIDMIIDEFGNNKEKMIIIPTSDKSAAALDSNYKRLYNRFVIYSINKQENKINYYMDKYNQSQLFNECRVNCLKSYLIDLKKYDFKNIKYPCILKPNVSAEGDKMDIKICKDKKNLHSCLGELREKGYRNILVQDYLDYNNEYEITGFIYKNKISISGMTRKIRIWPQKKGSTTFGEVLSISKEVQNMIEKVLFEIKFEGVFDIELFEKDNVFYFNEINFRNSGHSYAYRECNPAYYWYLSNEKNEFVKSPSIKNNYFFINDQAEIHNVLEKNISIFEYIKDKRKSKILLVKNKMDPKPSRYMLINKIKNKIKR